MNNINLDKAISDDTAVSIIESFLFTFSEPIDIYELVSIFKINGLNSNVKYVKNLLDILKKRYLEEKSGLEILQLENKYQIVSKKSNFIYLEKIISPKKKKNLTQSAIETLAIIAYNQPTTKAFIEKIKGVKSDTTISKLIEANLIQECGRLDKIGRPILYKTTENFLKNMGISSINELPDIGKMSKSDEDI